MNATATAITYARQRGIPVDAPEAPVVDESLTTGALLDQAREAGVPGVNTKTRKPALIQAMTDFFASRRSASVDIDSILPKLTARQRRRLRKRGLTPASEMYL